MSSTVLITGTNRGIGLELCRQLANRDWQVIATCRSASDELKKLGVEIIEDVEVTDPDSLKKLASTLGSRKLDWLINNAGIAGFIGLEEMDDNVIQSMMQMYKVNSLGPLLTTQALLGNLREGSKVGIITSRMGSIADNDSGGSYGYRMSKAAVNAAGKSLSIDLQPKGIAIAILHPGWVRTDMTGHNGLIDPDESASGLIQRMDELTLETSGSFWHTNGELLPW